MGTRCIISFFLAMTLFCGCEHETPVEPEPPAASAFDEIQATIFTPSCALSGCHAGANAQQQMDLSEGRSYGSIVGVPSRERPDLLRVDPGDPDASYLLMKIEGAPGIVGARMPLGRSPLSAAQIALVRSWIADGATED